MSVCPLCKKEAPLVKSHIIPKFAGDWLKKTSATGYLRSVDKPNNRKQDIIKVNLLCSECENKFSGDEKFFKEQIFEPAHNKNNEMLLIPYSDELFRFVLFTNWKVLVYFYNNVINEERFMLFEKEISRAINEWRVYLNGEETHAGDYEHHLVPFFNGFPPDFKQENTENLNNYVLRSEDFHVFTSDTRIVVYCKFPGVFLISTIKPKSLGWQGTQIQPLGMIGGRLVMDSGFFDYVAEQAKEAMKKYSNNLSDKQRERIKDAYLENPERVLSSGTFKAHLLDEALRKEDPKADD